MAESYEKLAQAKISVTTDAPAIPVGSYLYESPAGTQTIIKHIRVASIAGSGNRTFKMYHTDGAAPVDANMIFPSMTVDDGGMAEFEGTILLDSLDRLYVRSDVANTLVMTVYGLKKS